MYERGYPENLWVEANQKIKERDYWLSKLSGDLVKSSFPYDFKKPTHTPGVHEFETDSLKFRFPGDLSLGLIKLSKQSDLRLHIIFTAGVLLLLQKYTGNQDITVGMPILIPEIEGQFINTVLAVRVQFNDNISFKELLLKTSQTIYEAMEHQNYPIYVLLEQLNISCAENDFPLFDGAVLLENIHDKSYINQVHPNILFTFSKTGGYIESILEYNNSLYQESTIERISNHLKRLFQKALLDIGSPLSDIGVLSEEERQEILFTFNETHTPYPGNKTIHELFDDQVGKTPDFTALQYENQSITYRQLEKRANRLANYLFFGEKISPGSRIGILMNRSIEMIAAILGILKAGGGYVPMEISFPEGRIKDMINDAGIEVLVSQKRYINVLNRLQWECPGFHTFICLDSDNIYWEEEEERSRLMDKKLWEYVGDTAVDEITAGGWQSSYTGKPIPRQEMDEYGDNILEKLTPFLNKEMRVLEIGCASGITMFRIAPKVGFYCGTDLSDMIIEKNKERTEKENHHNISLHCLPAHEINTIGEDRFDLVIMNSVIQCFHGHNYLRKVIKKAVAAMGDKGYIFVGDVMDQELKGALIKDLMDFKQSNKDKDFKTKIDWSTELFISRSFFEDLVVEIEEIQEVEFSGKIYSIENELTKFRYDALFTVDKKGKKPGKKVKKHKYQRDSRVLETYGEGRLENRVTPAHFAYIIYTSGSTGKPKGILTKHYNVNRVVKETNYIDLNRDDRILQLSNYAFDGSVFDIFGALLNGAKLVLIPGDDVFVVDKVPDLIKRDRISVFFVTTALFNILLDNYIESLEGIRKVLFGGEKVSVEHAKKALEYLGQDRIIHVYGPTETTVYATYYFINHIDERGDTIPIGKPLSNTTLYIVDKRLKPLPLGVGGELCIGGDGLAAGYLNDVEYSSRKFIENPFAPAERLYRSGDLARWLPGGDVEFLGRSDSQVKIRGFRIELGEIENVLKRYQGIKEAVVLTRKGSAANEKPGEAENILCAYIVLVQQDVPNPGGEKKELDITQLREYLAGELPDYMIPVYFVQLEEITLTPNGKVDWKKLPAPVAERPQLQTEAPRDEIEEKFVEIWSEVLGIEKGYVGIHSDFFELGGHSLNLTTMVSMVKARLDIRIPLVEVFRTPTIKEIVEYIHSQETGLEILTEGDDNLVLLRREANPEGHLFLIHAGSGDVEGYIELCKRSSHKFSFWGIRADKIEHYTPREVRIEDLAAKYVKKIKKIQPRGPYHIAGWCIGGTIAFEMVKQLEQMGEEIMFFAIINAIAPHLEVTKGAMNFTFEAEKKWISGYFEENEIKRRLEGLPEMNRIWPTIMDYFEENKLDVDVIKKAIPTFMADAIPNLEQQDLKGTIYYLNMIRTYFSARNKFIPDGKIKIRPHFFEAGQTRVTNKEYWNDYCTRPFIYHELKGNHVSIFQTPDVVELAEKFDGALTDSIK